MVPRDTVKYEIDKISGYLKVDRPQKYSNTIPALYGFVPQTFCHDKVGAYCSEKTGRKGIKGDGDPLDICILTENEIVHGNIIIEARPIGGFRMIDNNFADDKIIAVLNNDAVYGAYTDISDIPELVENRPPSLCVGCGHHDVYRAMNEAVATFGSGRVFSDIGCYTLGALEPYKAINTCVDMGASITMAKGAADAGLVPALSVIGDSTFTHSGMTGLLDAVLEKSPITVIISDNESTSMTGGQESSAKGKIEDICIAIGVEPEHLHVINPIKKNHGEMVKMIKDELNYNGVSVIVPRRICVQKNRKDIKLRKLKLATK
jgi:TPP-dependent indolepyruvate ferredoxin oxidoreductase alpha subunit